MKNTTTKKIYSLETLIFLIVFFGLFGSLASVMGLPNMMNTLMNTAYALLMDTVFYIMAISVIAPAITEIAII